MTPDNKRGRPLPPGRPATNHIDSAQRNPTARAYAGPPCRGRGLTVVAIMTCPCCGGMHIHRVGDTAPLFAHQVMKCCPVTGIWYRLTPVQRRREAVRRAS